MSEPGVLEMLKALQSRHCWCGADKRYKQFFCSPCYFALPSNLQGHLYRRRLRKLAEAWNEARTWLIEHQSEVKRLPLREHVN